ncbi:hypothetical protein PP501_gp31 [Gordonia phage Powerball]|uniref:Uncharacterized protein n=1 Tax=Gordonia phage Powerball TaxID=2599847 RepID=A0A5J6TRR3_9CAUD|nr:hypothetical protein PP501_gp31 [Gordonia phage Powerball]QFG13510.1 hypothetical protein PBI_POWERBALL_31 [Gordonia phage Powerball]
MARSPVSRRGEMVKRRPTNIHGRRSRCNGRKRPLIFIAARKGATPPGVKGWGRTGGARASLGVGGLGEPGRDRV